AVRTPHRVDLAAADLEVDATEDLFALDTCSQPANRQLAHWSGSSTKRSSPSRTISYTRTGCVAGNDWGSPVTSENVLPCFQHSISSSSSHTSPSDSGTSACVHRSATA